MILILKQLGVRSISKSVIEAQSTAAAVGVGTASLGVAKYMNMVGMVIGTLATILGIVLTLVLIVIQIRKFRLYAKEKRLEIELLQAEVNEVNGD